METFVFFSIIFAGLMAWFALMRVKPTRFRKKAMLTGGERDFYFRLRNALPECHVCPQVAVSALIEPAGMGKVRQRAVSALGGKRVGYAVFDEELELLAVVELAHRSRPTHMEKAREACLASAGIRTVRFQAKRLPSEAKIRSSIFARSVSRQCPQLPESLDRELEFRKPVWRNTINAHI